MQHITCGVPQGSILGPLLFIIYMNDICNLSALLFTVLYADDTSVVIHGKDMLSITQQLLTMNYIRFKHEQKPTNYVQILTKYYVIFHRARIKLTDNDYPIINLTF